MDPELLTRWQALNANFDQAVAHHQRLVEEADLLLHFHCNFRRTRFSTTDRIYLDTTHSPPPEPSPPRTPDSPPYHPRTPPFAQGNGATSSQNGAETRPPPQPSIPPLRPSTPLSDLHFPSSPSPTRPRRRRPLLRPTPRHRQDPSRPTQARQQGENRPLPGHRPPPPPIPLHRQPINPHLPYHYFPTADPRYPLVIHNNCYWDYRQHRFLPYHYQTWYSTPRH
jgi:hypothetical protein